MNGPGRRQCEVKGDVTGWMDGEKVGKWAVKCRRYGGRILNENVELKGEEEWRTNTAVGIMYFVEFYILPPFSFTSHISFYLKLNFNKSIPLDLSLNIFLHHIHLLL